MQRSGIPVETNSCECGLKGFVRSWIKDFLWKLLLYRKFLLQMQTKWIYVHLALPVWLWDMWGHFLQKRRENHFFIVPHWKGTLIKHKHNFMLKYGIEKRNHQLDPPWRMCKWSHLTYDQHYFDPQTNLLTKHFWRQNLQFLSMDKFLLFWFAVHCSPLQWTNSLVAKFVIVIFQYWQLIEQFAILKWMKKL